MFNYHISNDLLMFFVVFKKKLKSLFNGTSHRIWTALDISHFARILTS